MKNGLESAGRALSHGLTGYRVELRRISVDEILASVYHAQQSVKLTQRILTNAHATNPFVMGAIVASMRVEADAVGLFVETPVVDTCLTA